MPKSSSELGDDLARKFRALNNARVKITSLSTQNLITQQVMNHLYEGLFLSAHVAFEVFLEDLFIGLLVDSQGLVSSRRDIVPRIVVKTHAIARDIVLGAERQYIDWLPYQRTVNLAQIYFRGGRPFSELDQPQKDYLNKCHTIRNAIAHKSRYSMKKFEESVIGLTPLPPNERKPAGYLSGYFRRRPAQTRYENLIAQMLLIAYDLAR
jgi:hypothetical protein